MTMRVALGLDHDGFPLRQGLLTWLWDDGGKALDLGASNLAPDDYLDFAAAMAGAVAVGRADRGILVCGSGIGASVAADKVRSVCAAVCHGTYSARQGVEHDDMGVLCLGDRVVGPALARELGGAFLGARFTGEDRRQRRLHKVLTIEERAATESKSSQRSGGHE